MHEESAYPQERPLALACPLTTSTLLNTLEAATWQLPARVTLFDTYKATGLILPATSRGTRGKRLKELK